MSYLNPQPTKTLTIDSLAVAIYKSPTKLAQAAAQTVQNYLQDVLSQKEKARVVWATGSSQIKFLAALTALGGVNWNRVTCFHLDEYLGIKATHPGSFRYYLQEKVENIVKPGKFAYLEGDTNEPLQECDRYAKLIQAQPIDLCFLGVGENGHLAFNEPYLADFNDPYPVKLVKLTKETRQQQVATGYFPKLAAVPKYAFTLTIPTILSARKIICLAPKQRKNSIVREMLTGKISSACPASFLRRQTNATLFLDTEAASLL
ncbi:MAG: glucosamine-6-phosphate deaminase [Oscillatoria sp. PMC 1051.18]|uniref:glucosamine-6-phosphate deaminase n=1 Tax=Oscillatoria salina TaxID=331517 RepID=UPI0013BA6AFF|nr:glucosamine-6-phosphate deaminase [Oscillatoria salina]MBZ8182229.1 glucosamine-6-phosphate deaminase [Oscillatoria salina IIICB1]MEC4895393.1 glucosamine-6-phosphate deaminase [Oscillatoria sp. PMC 1050.18]MEC5031943.1 glucosamine-6-phosphate deaminase [Oscillatoria sp. PMC 1051.18]NET90998.1 glucosamine-6-phosphate deaminase [Kamptonema sp. SIO1D9]